MFVSVRTDISIFGYNYFYMIETIRAARPIIPAVELTFLSLHMDFYSKVRSIVLYILWSKPSISVVWPLILSDLESSFMTLN